MAGMQDSCLYLRRSYISRVLSFLTTIRGIVSSFSYVVKRFPQVSHCLRRLIELLSSAGRESITFVSAALQNGHFNRSSPFLVLLICPRQVFITYHIYYNIAGSALLQAEVFRYSFFSLSSFSLTRIMSSPIWQMSQNGIMYSFPAPESPRHSPVPAR